MLTDELMAKYKEVRDDILLVDEEISGQAIKELFSVALDELKNKMNDAEKTQGLRIRRSLFSRIPSEAKLVRGFVESINNSWNFFVAEVTKMENMPLFRMDAFKTLVQKQFPEFYNALYIGGVV